MKFLKLNPKKNKAQAVVEFAIALPILLLIVYGLIETGRLLFIYTSVINAGRQAARYGSTSGVGPNGVPRYQDCAGIREAAQKGDFLNAFDDNDITITYDDGTSPYTTHTTLALAILTPVLAPITEDRVNVNITADYNALVPLVPFISRTVAGGNPIIGSSSRTLLLSISIKPLETNTFTSAPSPTPTLTFTPSLTYTPSKTPTITLTPLVTFTPYRTPTATRPYCSTANPATDVPGCDTIIDIGQFVKMD